MKAHIPRVRVSPRVYGVIEQHTRQSLQACRVLAENGTAIYIPDASGNYPALLTRDFCFMVEGAGHLMPRAEILGCIDYIISGCHDDGTVPDRVYADGHPVYHAGPEDAPLGARPPADNAQFLAKMICAYAELTGDGQALQNRMDHVIRAMETVPRTREGLVYIDPNSPHSSYGFTDCIGKTGKEFFCSMLYWETCQRLGTTCAGFEFHDDAHYWYELAQAPGANLDEFLDADSGLFMAASEDCKQIDIWGNAYASVVRVASKSVARRIAEFFIDSHHEFVLRGHIRHLPAGEYWDRLLTEVAPDTYQNGGYWALPSGWVAQTIALLDEEKARELPTAIAAEFDEHGVSEWISTTDRRLSGYAAAAAAVLGAILPAKALAEPWPWTPRRTRDCTERLTDR